MPTAELTHDPIEAKQFFEMKLAFTTGPVELNQMLQNHENINVIDVRDEQDYAAGHIPGAVNLPREKWKSPSVLDKRKTNILYCYSQVCHLAAKAAVEFASAGYPVMEMDGGFEAWRENDLPIEIKRH
jgi:rhodanese-related sulfurtransferase